jgi:soluble lytic murein transglycosylase
VTSSGKTGKRVLAGLAAVILVGALAVPAQAQGQRRLVAQAASVDAAFVQLRDAARNFEAERTEQLAAQIPPDYPLAMYADFWIFRTRFVDRKLNETGRVSDAQVREFIAKYPDTFVADRIRNDWLLVLGDRKDWKTFDEQYPLFQLQDDQQVVCMALQSRLTKGEAVGDQARRHLNRIGATAGSDGCVALIAALAESGAWSAGDVWERIRLLHESGQVAASKLLIPALPLDQRPDPLNFDTVTESPARLLTTRGGAEGRLTRELTVLALARVARQDAAGGNQSIITEWLKRLPAKDARFVRLQYAAACAKRLGVDCNGWLADIEGAAGSEDTLAWAARAALRAQDYKALARVLAAMGEDQFKEPTWTYWNARSLKALGAPREEWAAVLDRIKDGFDFYGLLAREDLGGHFVLPPKSVNVSDEDLQEARGNAAGPRAFKFYELNMRFEGNREWNWQLRGLSDAKLAAYAEFGRRSGFLDRMVNTSERSRESHDFSQRFPVPFVEKLRPIAESLGLDVAWVYGLIRQESRFIMNARSSVGASGLMQLMPATARYVAKKIGMDYDQSRIDDVEKNLTLGANYLALVYNDLENSAALASAAYNAGPGRPRAWRATLPRAVEGAIFAETIPFTETRGYVKSVLANATIYAAVLGQTKAPSLKERLGRVVPKSAGTTDLP